MKTITLTEPWATLVALGEKRIETRSWATAFRGPLAIHAAKGWPRACRDLCMTEPFRYVLEAHLGPGFMIDLDQARGHVVATCQLVAVERITPEISGWSRGEGRTLPHELDFGDYTPGRFAWLLDEVTALERPIRATGALGLWELPWPIEVQQ